jgi:hypothetical protein
VNKLKKHDYDRAISKDLDDLIHLKYRMNVLCNTMDDVIDRMVLRENKHIRKTDEQNTVKISTSRA